MDHQDRRGDEAFESAVESRVRMLALSGWTLETAREEAARLSADLDADLDGYDWLDRDEQEHVRQSGIWTEAWTRYAERLESGEPLPRAATAPEGAIF